MSATYVWNVSKKSGIVTLPANGKFKKIFWSCEKKDQISIKKRLKLPRHCDICISAIMHDCDTCNVTN